METLEKSRREKKGEKERPAFQGYGKPTKQVGRLRYFFHWLYGRYEPILVRFAHKSLDKIEKTSEQEEKEKLKNKYTISLDSKIAKNLPHSIVLGNRAAKNLVEYVMEAKGPRGARLAVGPCVCQHSMKKYKEPVLKDITLFYGADIYKSLNMGYEEISVDQAKAILDNCHDAGLIHNGLYCYDSAQGLFVCCNCDHEICGVMRGYNLVGAGTSPGPEICTFDSVKCYGPDECGKCVDRCMVHVNSVGDGKIHFEDKKCLGCELCVTTCPSGARAMTERQDYEFEHIMPKELLLKGLYDEEANP